MHVNARLRQGEELLEELGCVLDPEAFKVRAEPMRIEILKFLLMRGRSDIATIAEAFPLDRSVISRHLGKMEEHDFLVGEKVGRNRFYRVDLDCFIESFEKSAAIFRRIRERLQTRES